MHMSNMDENEFPNFNPIGFEQVFQELPPFCPKCTITQLQPAGERVESRINNVKVRILQAYCDKCRWMYWKELNLNYG